MIVVPYAGRLVVERTEMTGVFDMEVAFAEDLDLGSDAVSIFTAVREQLGLNLESRLSEVMTLVIDSIERPSEN